MVHFITKPVKNTHVIVVITIVFKGFKTRGIETISGFPMVFLWFSYGLSLYRSQLGSPTSRGNWDIHGVTNVLDQDPWNRGNREEHLWWKCYWYRLKMNRNLKIWIRSVWKHGWASIEFKMIWGTNLKNWSRDGLFIMKWRCVLLGALVVRRELKGVMDIHIPCWMGNQGATKIFPTTW